MVWVCSSALWVLCSSLCSWSLSLSEEEEEEEPEWEPEREPEPATGTGVGEAGATLSKERSTWTLSRINSRLISASLAWGYKTAEGHHHDETVLSQEYSSWGAVMGSCIISPCAATHRPPSPLSSWPQPAQPVCCCTRPVLQPVAGGERQLKVQCVKISQKPVWLWSRLPLKIVSQNGGKQGAS